MISSTLLSLRTLSVVEYIKSVEYSPVYLYLYFTNRVLLNASKKTT